MKATFGLERELENNLHIIEYENGNGDFHFHSQIEICLVQEGKLDALVNNNATTLNEGEISVALSYDTHVYIPLNYARFTVLIIPTHMCEKFISAIQDKKISNPFICGSESTGKIKAYVEELKKETTNEIEKLGYIYLILGIVMENMCFEAPAKYTETELLTKLLLYIHKNFNKDLTLQSISQAFGYNPSYISRYFKSALDIGIIQYINIIRLKNVIKLMHTKRHSITYCALESGFNSLRTFYRVFRSEFNCSPKEYLTMSCYNEH